MLQMLNLSSEMCAIKRTLEHLVLSERSTMVTSRNLRPWSHLWYACQQHWRWKWVLNQCTGWVKKYPFFLRLLHMFPLAAVVRRRKFTQLFAIHILTYLPISVIQSITVLNICENCNTFCNINPWILTVCCNIHKLFFWNEHSLHDMKSYSKSVCQ